MKKQYTRINVKKLFDCLDWYNFVSQDEIIMCICDYIEDKEGSLYYSDWSLACELSDEYIKKNKIRFN